MNERVNKGGVGKNVKTAECIASSVKRNRNFVCVQPVSKNLTRCE